MGQFDGLAGVHQRHRKFVAGPVSGGRQAQRARTKSRRRDGHLVGGQLLGEVDRIGEVALGQRRLRPQVQRLPVPLGMPRLQGGRRGAQRQFTGSTPVAVVPGPIGDQQHLQRLNVFDAFERSRRSGNHAQLFDLDAQSPGQKLDHLGRCGPTAALQMGDVAAGVPVATQLAL